MVILSLLEGFTGFLDAGGAGDGKGSGDFVSNVVSKAAVVLTACKPIGSIRSVGSVGSG